MPVASAGSRLSVNDSVLSLQDPPCCFSKPHLHQTGAVPCPRNKVAQLSSPGLFPSSVGGLSPLLPCPLCGCPHRCLPVSTAGHSDVEERGRSVCLEATFLLPVFQLLAGLLGCYSPLPYTCVSSLCLWLPHAL